MVSLAIAGLLAGVAAPVLRRWTSRRVALWTAGSLVVLGIAHDLWPWFDLGAIDRASAEVGVLSLGGADGPSRLLLLAALVWCGPAADLVVRRALDATSSAPGVLRPFPGARAGRWIGRLERWLLVLCIAAGEPALAVIPVGGKALFRYAEVLADARAERPRLDRRGPEEPPVPRDALVDYVIVGSLASWAQGITLGLLVATA